MIVKQIKDGVLDNFSYLIGCEKTREAIVVDPAGDVDRILNEAQKAGLNIKYIVNTHGHGDHASGNARLKELTSAKIIMHNHDADRYKAIDIQLDQEKTLQLGEIQFQIFHIPGHIIRKLMELPDDTII